MKRLVFGLTSLVFLPALWNGFVDWDEGVYLVANPHIRGLSLSNLGWMLGTFNLGHYMPVTWLSFAMDYTFWGLNPAGFHLTNVLLHALNAVLFFLVGRRLLAAALPQTRDGRALSAGAAAAALLFSLHPLRVESVAWAFERKDMLFALFYLASVWAYLRSLEKTRRGAWRALSLACYALSLLSKAMGIGLPVVLLTLDVYPLRRKRTLGLLLEKLPYALLAAAATAVTLMSYKRMGVGMPLASYGIAARLDQAFFGLSFYLEKTALPIGLSPRYLHPSMDPFAWAYLLRGLAVCALTAALWLARRRFPAGLAAWIFYAVSLAPVLGVVPQSSQIAADRYSYLPCLSWSLLAGAGVALLWTRGGVARKGALAAAITLSSTLAVLAVRQIAVWRGSVSLWSRAVALEPRDVLARAALGKALEQDGRPAEALEQFEAALAINPDYAAARNDLGILLAKQGRLEEAAKQFQAAAQADPNLAEARANLQKALEALGGKRRAR